MTMEELMKLPEAERREWFQIFFNVRKPADNKSTYPKEALL